MKKFLVILSILIGFSFSVQSEKNHTSQKTVLLAWGNPNNCSCPDCNEKLVSEQRTEEKWFDCYLCGGDGFISCAVEEWVECRYCNGSGCKNGYTTNNGKNCAYGECSYCKNQGGEYKNVLKSNACDCTSYSCKKDPRSGRYGEWKIGRYYNVLVCPRCKKEYGGC